MWHGAARLLGTSPCTAHCQKPPPSYSRFCAVSTRQSRPLLRAAPRQRGRFFIIFGPLSAIAAVRARRCMGRQTAGQAYRVRSAGLEQFRHRRIPAREGDVQQKMPPCWRLERLHTREASSGRISVDLARTVERPAVDDAVPWRALAACRMTEAGPNRGRSCHTTYSGRRAVHASGHHPWSS